MSSLDRLFMACQHFASRHLARWKPKQRHIPVVVLGRDEGERFDLALSRLEVGPRFYDDLHGWRRAIMPGGVAIIYRQRRRREDQDQPGRGATP